MTSERTLDGWAVEYKSEVECEYGYTHKIGNILIGLGTEEEAKKRAIELKGRVTKHPYTPRLSDTELKQLNDEGIPVRRTPWGLSIKNVTISDTPASLDTIRELYRRVV